MLVAQHLASIVSMCRGRQEWSVLSNFRKLELPWPFGPACHGWPRIEALIARLAQAQYIIGLNMSNRNEWFTASRSVSNVDLFPCACHPFSCTLWAWRHLPQPMSILTLRALRCSVSFSLILSPKLPPQSEGKIFQFIKRKCLCPCSRGPSFIGSNAKHTNRECKMTK